jgi:phage-related baseplate assembly protein
VGYAITSIQQGLDFAIAENVDASGGTRPGSFVITVDDGSGYPPSSLLSTVYGSVDAVRPIGSVFSVQPPDVISANVTLTLTIVAGASSTTVVSVVTSAITSYINALSIGELLPLSRLAQVAYDASGAITNVTQLLVNGSTADIIPGSTGIVKVGTVAVS